MSKCGKLPFKTAEANAKSYLRSKGIIDQYLKVLDPVGLNREMGVFRKYSKEKYGITANWISMEGNRLIINKAAFKAVDELNGVKYKSDVDPSEYLAQLNFLDPQEINYALKSTQILSSSRADEIFRKGDKNNWSLEKILTELQVPQEQKQLLLSFNTKNREELLTNLLANYSYTVEINTAKEKTLGDDNTTYTTDGVQYVKVGENDYRKRTLNSNFEKITKEEFEKNQNKPTQYYSNLTVPGGTNGSYREQNFETPLIKVPKSHAQFNTENTIGFSRNDDRQIYTEKDINSLLEIMQKSGILEIKC